MQTLVIEWKHLDVEGNTCDRCGETGANLLDEIAWLNEFLAPKGVAVELVETRLDPTQISESNALLVNGVPIEEILNIEVFENSCDSCSQLVDSEVCCRTIVYEKKQYDEIPAKAIREAALKVLGLEGKAPSRSRGSECGCGKGSCC